MLLDKLPFDAVLLFFVALFAATKARDNVKVSVIAGVQAVGLSVALGYLLGWVLYTYTILLPAAVVAICSVASYLGGGIMIAIEKAGARVLSKPELIVFVLHDILPPALARVLSAIFPTLKTDEQNKNPS